MYKAREGLKVKAAWPKFVAALMMLGVTAISVYYWQFKTITNDDILAYGWKGGGCDSLPDVLDFRGGYMTLNNDQLLIDNKLAGHIVKREYRTYDDGFIEVPTETGELCPFWAKWKN